MRCFCAQLVGRSSSFNSISAAGDGHPESGLSNGAVSWQNPPTHTHTHIHAHTDTHTHTQGSAQTHWKKSWCRWHIWSSMPQLRVSYGCWQGAKSQEERKYGEEKKSESVKMKVIHPGFSLFRLSLLFICLFVFFFQSVSVYNFIQKKNIRKKKKTHPH